MKKLLVYSLFLALIGLKISLFAQDRKDLMISLGVGSLGSPVGKSFNSPTVGIGYALDMSYLITQRHIISSNYTSGNHDYTEPSLRTSLPIQLIPATSQIEFRILSLLYKYRVINIERFSLALGTGLSLQTFIKRIPDYKFENGLMTSLSYMYVGTTDLAFPLKAEFSFNLSRNWAIGLESGIFLMPTVNPWSGVHLLPRLSYIFR